MSATVASPSANVAPQAAAALSQEKLNAALSPSDRERFHQIMQEFVDKNGAGASEGQQSATSEGQADELAQSASTAARGVSLTDLISDAIGSSSEKNPAVHNKDKRDRRTEENAASANPQGVATAFSSVFNQLAQSGFGLAGDQSFSSKGQSSSAQQILPTAITGSPDALGDMEAAPQAAAGLYDVIETKTHLAVAGTLGKVRNPQGVIATGAPATVGGSQLSHPEGGLPNGADRQQTKHQERNLKDASQVQINAPLQDESSSSRFANNQAAQTFNFATPMFGMPLGGPLGASGPIAVSDLPQAIADFANNSATSDSSNAAIPGQGGQAVKEIRLSLTPPDLGSVSVHMKLGAHGLDVTIAADHQLAIKQIDGLKDTISSLLASSGNNVNSVTVKAADGSASSQSSFGQNGQANAQGSGAFWEGAGRGDNAARFQRGGQSDGRSRGEAESRTSSPNLAPNEPGARADGLFV